MINQNFNVLSICKYDFVDEKSGKQISGYSIMYLEDTDNDNYLAHKKVSKASLPITENLSWVTTLPQQMNLGFEISGNKLKLVKISPIQK